MTVHICPHPNKVVDKTQKVLRNQIKSVHIPDHVDTRRDTHVDGLNALKYSNIYIIKKECLHCPHVSLNQPQRTECNYLPARASFLKILIVKNLCILIGHLGQNPTSRTFSDGGMITEVSLATTEHYKDRNGEKQQVTDWHKIKFSGKLAEIANRYCHKGQLVEVSGKIKTRSYEKNGETRYVTYLQAYELNMLSKKEEASPSTTDDRYGPHTFEPAPDKKEEEGDDLPF